MKKAQHIATSALARFGDRNLSHVLLAFFVFLAGSIITGYYWRGAEVRLKSDVDSYYQRQVNLAKSLIMLRLQQYSNLLNGGAGLLAIDDRVNQDQWRAYYQAYNLPENYPGVDAVSFSKYVRSADLPDYLGSMAEQGRPNLKITPAGQRDAYAPVTYIAYRSPVSLHAIGFDPLSDSTRGAAIIKARDSGRPVMTGKISLVAAHKGQPAFIIYAPVYKGSPQTTAERQASIYGFVFAATNINNLLSSVLPQVKSPSFAFRIYDGAQTSNNALMYETSDFTATEHNMLKSSTITVNFDAHSWTFQAIAGKDFIPSSERQSPLLSLVRGLTVSFILAVVTWYIVSNRERRLLWLKQQEVRIAKDDLLSLASHQLRTPATIVKQYLGILLQNYAGTVSVRQRQLLDIAYSSNERQLQIINQFLDVARVDSGRLKLQKQPIDLQKLVKQVVEEQRKVVAERGQKIACILPKKPLNLQADPRYLPMALENLINNASKYTPRKGKITITVRRVKAELLISVKDTGIGITKEELKVIFDKFTRAENEFTADSNGSGIGLYLTEKIILLHRGSIDVDSKLSHGSTFTIHLPMSRK